MNNNFEIKVFNNGNVSVEVNFDKENNTVWLTQGEMAAKIGLTPSSYSNWELGKRAPLDSPAQEQP